MSEEREEMLRRMEANAHENGYHLCPDKELLDTLIDGLVSNEKRYGYGACPCRIASGIKTYDSDIICPCEYRDADAAEFGMCYCALFVTTEVKEDPSKMKPVPERRPIEAQDAAMEALDGKVDGKEKSALPASSSDTIPIWRCTVCGYLAARETPPPICPICKVKADKFEPFGFGK
ncbi:MAG: ferredoxin-thioredoxin reductase catalytic domain-containing protein [Candidatus Thermoplasmatota archaeon]|nr:ferredoxin-thioredoxin reductase catalytic domain-containing protein [Candidatus Thermoplasmatota archaeon]